MVSIYLIQDIKGLKYVGSTKSTLKERLRLHKYDKKRGKYCSSSELNLEDCIIIELERCSQENKKVREQYAKDTTDCVNKNNIIRNDKETKKIYREKNKEQIKQLKKNAYEKKVIQSVIDDMISNIY